MVHGNFPESLYRAFDEECYRDAFLSGKFRMGALKRYRDIEDARRRDQSEGEAVYRWKDMVQSIHIKPDSDDYSVTEAPGLMTSTSSLGNPVYIFCTSMPSVDLDFMKEQFGRYIVEITNPFSFAKDIATFFSQSSHRLSNGIRGCQVQYNKGELVQTKLGVSEGMSLSYTQKPASFIKETEFRCVAVLFREEKQNPFIDVNLGYQLNYAKPI